jgi:hypothetical protein
MCFANCQPFFSSVSLICPGTLGQTLTAAYSVELLFDADRDRRQIGRHFRHPVHRRSSRSRSPSPRLLGRVLYLELTKMDPAPFLGRPGMLSVSLGEDWFRGDHIERFCNRHSILSKLDIQMDN